MALALASPGIVAAALLGAIASLLGSAVSPVSCSVEESVAPGCAARDPAAALFSGPTRRSLAQLKRKRRRDTVRRHDSGATSREFGRKGHEIV